MRRSLPMVAVFLLGTSVADMGRADDKNRCTSASEKGQQQRDAGKYSAARDAFGECARDTCPSIVRRDCTRWLSDLEQLQPSVVFGVKDPSGNDLSAVSVYVDGKPLVASLDGKPVPVDPGEHVFRFEAQGMSPIERPFVMRAGERSRRVAAQFGETKSNVAPTLRPTPPAPAADDTGIPSSAWVFGGLAVVAFGAEAYFGITGLSDRSSLESQPCAKPATCSAGDVNSVRTKFTIADIALAVGLVSGALAAYMFFTRGHAEHTDAPAARLDVTPVSGGAAATWRLRF